MFEASLVATTWFHTPVMEVPDPRPGRVDPLYVENQYPPELLPIPQNPVEFDPVDAKRTAVVGCVDWYTHNSSVKAVELNMLAGRDMYLDPESKVRYPPLLDEYAAPPTIVPFLPFPLRSVIVVPLPP